MRIGARVAGEIGGAIDGTAVTAVAHAAGKVGAAGIDGRRNGSNVKIRRIQADIVGVRHE